MKHLLLILIILLPQISLSQAPEKMTEIVFVGEYTIGRTPCEFLLNGTRRWAKTKGFKVAKVIKGNLKTDYVEVNFLDKKVKENILLEQNKEYLIKLLLSDSRLKKLGLDKASIRMTYKNPVIQNEIIKIVKEI